jgi:DNA-binding response OmpR family regulator
VREERTHPTPQLSDGRVSRRVLVVDGEPASGRATEDLLRREDYWAVVTHDPVAAEKLARVGAADVLAVDLNLGALEVVPRWQRRQGDPSPRETPPQNGDGYAVLRALHSDSSCARFPLFLLRARSDDESREPACRFGLIDYVPKASQPRDLVRGLDSVFRDVVEPALLRDEQRMEAEEGTPLVDATEWGRGETRYRPFDTVPKPLRTALLVDPDLAYRRYVRGVLAEHGFVVYEVSSSAEALQLAIARRPWLILSEVNLPDQSGFDLCARIRSHGLLRRTPLAFLSDWDEPDKRYAGLQLGADDYLVKPITIRELVIRLELILKRYKDLRPGGQPGAGFRGSVELVGSAGLLQVCHLNRLTGTLVVRHGAQQIKVAFSTGEIVGAAGVHLIRANGNDLRPEEIVYTLLAWPRGQFQFVPAPSVQGEPIGEGFDQILLEGCRRLDEQDLTGAAGS